MRWEGSEAIMKIAGAAVILLACNYLLSGSEIRVIIDRQSRDGRIVKFKFLSTLSSRSLNKNYIG